MLADWESVLLMLICLASRPMTRVGPSSMDFAYRSLQIFLQDARGDRLSTNIFFPESE